LISGTTGSDVFTVTYSTTTTTVRISSNGSAPTLVGTYSPGIPLSIAGLFGSDAVKVIGTAGKEQFTVSGTSVRTNSATVTVNSIENIELVGGGNDDIYAIDADTALPRVFIDEAGGGIDTLDFSLTTLQAVNVNLGSSLLQTVNINLGLQLRNPTALENLIGGSRDDGLIGNANANFLVGGPGNDLLDGQAGRDLLIGGLGRDQLSGGLDDDVVITGGTTYDGNISALNDLIAEWKSTAPYSTRVTRLRSGVGVTRAMLVAKSTVLHDSFAADIVRGDAGQDWFFCGVEERAIDQLFGEISDRL
jgi:Ca2+-binding RTX toxin-like protein